MAGTNLCCDDGNYDNSGTCTTISAANIPGVDTNCNRYKNGACI